MINRILFVACLIALAIALPALAQDVSPSGAGNKVIDQFLSTGIVGALCVAEAYMIRTLYNDLRVERDKGAAIAVKNAELVAENTQAMRDLREEIKELK